MILVTIPAAHKFCHSFHSVALRSTKTELVLLPNFIKSSFSLPYLLSGICCDLPLARCISLAFPLWSWAFYPMHTSVPPMQLPRRFSWIHTTFRVQKLYYMSPRRHQSLPLLPAMLFTSKLTPPLQRTPLRLAKMSTTSSPQQPHPQPGATPPQ